MQCCLQKWILLLSLAVHVNCKVNYYDDIGCWIDTVFRAIPSQEDFLEGSYKTREFAIEKCAEHAQKQGYEVFAIQDGGQCFSGPNATDTYWKYGQSTLCNANGKGGLWANQVYEIKAPRFYRQAYVGCFKDTIIRAIPIAEGKFVSLRDDYKKRKNAVKKCADIAARLEHRMFAVQDGGQCFTSDTAEYTYNKYGTSSNCQTGGKGGEWANAVYKIVRSDDIKLTDMGCWKDTSDRAIPSQDDHLPGKHKKRINAIKKCAEWAKSQNYNFFAIQDGGLCLSGPDAEKNYQKYGMSTACSSNGKGGPWANQVFEINRPRKKSSYSLIGCYKDTLIRAIPPIEKSFLNLHDHHKDRVNAIAKCAAAAAKLGNHVFGVQDGGWCVTSDTAETTYNVYGLSGECADDGEGGSWANAVYRIKSRPPTPKIPLIDLGCWKDTSDRAIPSADDHIGGPYKTRKDAIQKCAAYAKSKGYTVFGIQDGGWCATGPDAKKTFHKYGESTACNRNGKGGGWANQVYEIKANLRYHYKYVGCYEDRADRAISTVEKRFLTLHDNHKTRVNAIAKCAKAAAALGHKIFAVQDGGWCSTSKTAQNTYDHWGPSTKCLKDGEGALWANAVYRLIYEYSLDDIAVTDLGCWTDAADRAIPIADDHIGGPYGSRYDAVQKCAAYARDNGYEVFAIQDGGQCATGPDAKQTFYKHGPSFACLRGGKGGPWANQVYKINTKPEYSLDNLGCWKDAWKRAIPSHDGQIGGPYKKRFAALKKCADHAKSKGFEVFALQDGGQCMTGPNARKTYKKYGASVDCKNDGKGGPLANQVYAIKLPYKYKHLGCFKDAAYRAIPQVDGRFVNLKDDYKFRSNPVQKCSEAAAALGFKVFAVQDGGWCATSDTAHTTYNYHGTSTECEHGKEGGPWANSVYEINYVPPKKEISILDLGCWKDNLFRAIPDTDSDIGGPYKTRLHAIQRCAAYAKENGFEVFAIQDGGMCFTGKDAKADYNKHGPSTGCKEDGKGGPWANQVYEIERDVKYKYSHVGCFKDTLIRAMTIIEKRFVTLHGSYSVRTDAIEKCAKAAATLGYKKFGVQNGGQCTTSDTAENTYDKYGPSDKCKEDKEGGPWANDVYSVTMQ